MRRGRRIKRWVVVSHRWSSLALGLLLVVEVLSGVVLLFQPELFKIGNPELFETSASSRVISTEDALAIVRGRHPELNAVTVTLTDGVYQVRDNATGPQAFVDPGTGRVNGVGDQYGGVLGFLRNLHQCGLACKAYPGYLPLLNVPIIGKTVTVGALLLGVLGLLLAFLCVSGLIIWWPSMRRLATSLKIYFRRGHYRLNRDLHDALGMLAIPFLLMWAVTGAGYEFDWIGKLWYAATGSGEPAVVKFTSTPGTGPDIGLPAAEVAAHQLVPDGRIGKVTSPVADDPAGYYLIGLTAGADAVANSGVQWFPATTIGVDRRTGRAAIIKGAPDEPLGQKLWGKWNHGVHFGYAVSWPWRLVWLVFGLSPIMLAATGFWTWYHRRRRVRRSLNRAEQMTEQPIASGTSE